MHAQLLADVEEVGLTDWSTAEHVIARMPEPDEFFADHVSFALNWT